MKHVWKPPPNELTWKLWYQGLGNSWKTRVESIINIFFLWFDSLQPISAPSPTEFNFDFSLIPGSVPDPLSQQPFGVLPPAKRVVFQWWFFLVCFRLWWKKKISYSRVEDWFPGIAVSQAWRSFSSIHPGLRPWQYDGDPNLWSQSGKFTRSRSNKTTSPIRVGFCWLRWLVLP